MLKKENLKSYIDELIKEVEEELKESTTTGGVDGYQTPFAFSGKRKQDKAKADSNIEVTGYTKVKDIDESVNESWEVKDGKVSSNGKLIGYYEFDRDSDSFWVDDVKKGKGQLSFDTKREVEDYFKKNEKDALKSLGKLRGKYESVSEGLLDIIPYFKKKKEAAEKKQADILKRRQEMAYNNVKQVYDATISKLQDPKYSQDKDAKIKACNDLIWTVVSGAPKNEKLNWAGLKTSYDWDELNEFGMMDEIESSFGEILKVKTNKNESVTEGKVKRPVNRWLELKNDESMHANKKLAVGLKELKHQLSEVEKFFRWYNQIKTMNELSSDVFWKRTHGHIYKIKERLINIAKTIQEIEK